MSCTGCRFPAGPGRTSGWEMTRTLGNVEQLRFGGEPTQQEQSPGSSNNRDKNTKGMSLTRMWTYITAWAWAEGSMRKQRPYRYQLPLPQRLTESGDKEGKAPPRPWALVHPRSRSPRSCEGSSRNRSSGAASAQAWATQRRSCSQGPPWDYQYWGLKYEKLLICTNWRRLRVFLKKERIKFLMIKLETEKIVSLRINIFCCFSWKELKSDSSSLSFLVTILEKRTHSLSERNKHLPILPSSACSFGHTTALQFSWFYSIVRTWNDDTQSI